MSLAAAMLGPTGTHPAPDTLRRYAAGELSAAEQHVVEAHALGCERCADVLAGLAMSDTAATDRAVASLRHRLRARVAVPAPPATVLARNAAPQGVLWRRLALAASLAGLAAGGFWGWQRSRVAESAEVASTTPAPSETAVVPPAAVPVAAPAAAETADATAALSAPEAEPAAPRPAPRPPTVAATKAPDVAARAAPAATPGRARAPVAAAPAAPVVADASIAMAEAPIAADESLNASADKADSNKAADRPAGDEESSATAPTMASVAAESERKSKRRAVASPSDGAAPAAAMPPAPEIAPAPKGGTLGLNEYLRRRAAEFEPEADKSRLTGTVHVRIVVGENGQIQKATVTRGLRADYNAEALRLVCDGPAWQPAVRRGRRAPAVVDLRVPF